MSGYDIGRRFKGSEESLFGAVSFGAIYPALAKLEAKGQVMSTVQIGEGKPDRRTYRITEAGRQAFLEALLEPAAADSIHSPFLNFLRFAHLVPQTTVHTQISSYEAKLDDYLDRLQAVLENYPDMPTRKAVLEYCKSITLAMKHSLRALAHDMKGQ